MLLSAFALMAIGQWSSAKVTLRFLQFFQQDQYDSERFLAWWWRTKSFERHLSLICIGCSVLLALAAFWNEEAVVITACAGPAVS